jgi:hypothetical protein
MNITQLRVCSCHLGGHQGRPTGWPQNDPPLKIEQGTGRLWQDLIFHFQFVLKIDKFQTIKYFKAARFLLSFDPKRNPSPRKQISD